MDKKILQDLLESEPSIGIRRIAKLTNKSFSTVKYWLKKYNLKTEGNYSKYNWSLNNLLTAIENSKCKSDVLKHLGASLSTSNYQTLDKKIKEYNIDDSHLIYDYSRGNKWVKKYKNNDIFCENSKMSTKNIKIRIIKDSLIEYKCSECEIIDEWNGKKIVLQLDHINGNNTDNRIENLRFLCPNCHSQTKTFSRSKKYR